MLVGIIADIHSNVEGLRVALDRMGHVDELLCAGDAIFQYGFSNEVVELLRDRGARCVLGNHESTFLGPDGVGVRSDPTVRRENVAFLADLPTVIDVQVGGRRLLLVHGSPFRPYDTYVYPTSPQLHHMGELEADYVVLGHTHHAMAIEVGRTVVINPGSAGDGRDLGNRLDLSFAVLDTASGEVRFETYPDPARRYPVGVPPAVRDWPARARIQGAADGRRYSPKTLPPWIEEA